jgi:electron transfer flavoprotein alpha/beta subunit
MEYRDLIANVACELPFPDAQGAERALHATLTALFEAVPERTAKAVLAAFPGAPASLALAARTSGSETRAQLGARVATLLGDSEGRALEVAEVACAVLERGLPGDERAVLLRSVPQDLVPLFAHSATW